MKHLYIAYRPIAFPEEVKDPTLNRVSRSMLIQRIEAEANASFLKKAIVSPFEEALLGLDRDDFDTGEFEIEIAESTTPPRTSWAKVHDRLSEFLNVRADDSRAADFPGMRPFSGVGYCLRVEDLQTQVTKLIDEETSKPILTKSLTWPKKERKETHPIEILIPNVNYKRVTKESGIAVLEAKRFISGVSPNVIKPYQDELKRWFNANTGYEPPQKIPSSELGHDERIVEFARGSYGRVQLVREETPKYREVIEAIQVALGEMKAGDIAVPDIRSTQDERGVPYVNIKSAKAFLSTENLKKKDLVKVGHRYNITP
jgi:hypothetical protein